MRDRRVPRWAHVVGLALVLAALTVWVGTDVSFSIDEPAAIIQGKRLAAGDGWLLPDPLPGIDPEGRFPYLVLSDRGPAGTAPYAKHPAYPLLLAVADRVGGQTAMVLLSVAGAVVAAALAGRIARRLDPALETWTVWAAGVASPLFFDSQLVIAHTLGAVGAGAAALGALRLRERWSWGVVVGVAAALAGAAAVRTEAVLFAAVLGGAAALGGLRGRDRDRRMAVAGGLWAVAGAATLLIDRWLLARITGGPLSGVSTAAGRDLAAFLGTRVSSTMTMLLAPGDAWPVASQNALFLVLVAALVLGLLLRRARPSPVAVAIAGAGLLGAALAPFLLGSPSALPGILIAFPLLTVGLATLDGRLWRDPPARWLAGVGGSYTVAVALTQYAQAGGVEWGARYLAVALPVVVPVAVASVAAAARRAGPRTGPVAVGAVMAASLALASLAAWSLRHTHDATRRFIGRVAEAAAQAPGPDLGDGDRRPVVVATWFAVGRLTAVTGPPVRGLTVVDSRDVPEVGRRLHAAGVERFVLVSEERADLDALAPWYHRAATTGDQRIMVMERGAAPRP